MSAFTRKPSARANANRELLGHIEQVHRDSRECYGAYKTWRKLRAQGIFCGRHRIARLRREAGIEAKRKRRFRITTQARAVPRRSPICSISVSALRRPIAC